MSIESVMPSSHLILCYPLLLLPSIFPSIGAFQAPPGSQASSRGETKDSALLSSRDAGILEPPKIKSDTVSTVSPSISCEVVGPDAMNNYIKFKK